MKNSLSLLLLVIPATAFAQPKGEKIDFAHDVVPILKAKCAGCHTNGTYKGGLSLDTREAMLKAKAVVPGKAAESELVKRIATKDPDLLMPQKAAPLDEKQIAVIKRWIDEGAVWESGFSFKPPAYVAPLSCARCRFRPR